MAAPTLIYCASGNRRFMEIAINAGWQYGSQLPGTTYGPIFMADQDYRKFHKAKTPQRRQQLRANYMAALARHRPYSATVLDWDDLPDAHLPDVLGWAEEAAPHVQEIIIIPKVIGGIPLLPRAIGGKPIRLGYSVPTQYGGTSVPIWEFAGWPVHLLGGSPQDQMELVRYAAYLDVRSADTNYHQHMATKYCQFWMPGTARYASNRWWPTLLEADDKRWEKDAPYEAFARSCRNIMAAWQRIYLEMAA